MRSYGPGHEEERRKELLTKMFKSIDPDNPPIIEPPFTCDYVSPPSVHLTQNALALIFSPGSYFLPPPRVR
jgi:hypothetical protein